MRAVWVSHDIRWWACTVRHAFSKSTPDDAPRRDTPRTWAPRKRPTDSVNSARYRPIPVWPFFFGGVRTLFAPAPQITVRGPFEARHGGLKFLIDVDEGRRHGHALADAEGTPVRLAIVVVRVLTQDHHADLLERAHATPRVDVFGCGPTAGAGQVDMGSDVVAT